MLVFDYKMHTKHIIITVGTWNLKLLKNDRCVGADILQLVVSNGIM